MMDIFPSICGGLWDLYFNISNSISNGFNSIFGFGGVDGQDEFGMGWRFGAPGSGKYTNSEKVLAETEIDGEELLEEFRKNESFVSVRATHLFSDRQTW